MKYAIKKSVSYKTNKMGQGVFILVLAAIIMAAELIMPAVSSRVNAAMVALLLVVVTAVPAMNVGFNKIASVSAKVMPVFIIEVITILFSFINGESVGTDIFVFYKLFVWSIISWYVVQNGNKKLAIILLLMVSAFYVLTSITTYVGSNLFPGICRALTNSGERTDEIKTFASRNNIGGFSFVYSVVLLFPLCFYLLKNKLFNRLIVIAILISLAMMISVAGFTTAMLFSIVSTVLLFIPTSFSIKKLIAMSILVLAILYPMSNLIGDFFMNISDSAKSAGVSQRLYDVGATLKGEMTSQGSDFDHRMELWTNDIKWFFENPFFGSSKCTGHSYILDKISQFGLVGIILLFVEFGSIFKFFIKPYRKTKAYIYISFAFSLQIGLSLLNPVLSHEIFVLIIPLMIFVFEDVKLSY